MIVFGTQMTIAQQQKKSANATSRPLVFVQNRSTCADARIGTEYDSPMLYTTSPTVSIRKINPIINFCRIERPCDKPKARS